MFFAIFFLRFGIRTVQFIPNGYKEKKEKMEREELFLYLVVLNLDLVRRFAADFVGAAEMMVVLLDHHYDR